MKISDISDYLKESYAMLFDMLRVVEKNEISYFPPDKKPAPSELEKLTKSNSH
jgi:hypothetical protein